MANARSRRSRRASSPSTSRAVIRVAVFAGGVCGSTRQKTPSTIDAAAAICIGRAVSSSWRKPTARPATIQPMVPSTRMAGNCRPGFDICRNEIEFVSASVGM